MSPGLIGFIGDSSWQDIVYQRTSTTFACLVSNDAPVEYQAIILKVYYDKTVTKHACLMGKDWFIFT